MRTELENVHRASTILHNIYRVLKETKKIPAWVPFRSFLKRVDFKRSTGHRLGLSSSYFILGIILQSVNEVTWWFGFLILFPLPLFLMIFIVH